MQPHNEVPVNTKHSVSSKRKDMSSAAAAPGCLPFCGLGAEEALKLKASRAGVLSQEKRSAPAASQSGAHTDR